MSYRKFLDAIPELIFVTKADGVSGVFYNKSWYNFTGLTEEDALRGWESIVSPYDISRVASVIEKAAKAQQPYEVEVRLRCCQTDSYRWFLSKAQPIFSESGEVENYVGVSTDIHEIKMSIRDMQAVYDREMQKRLEKIAELETELDIHRTNK